MADKTPTTASQIARAIVHLNFNEPDEALSVLILALTDINFAQTGKEHSNGIRPAAA